MVKIRFRFGFFKTKKNKKGSFFHSAGGGGGEALVAGPLKKNLCFLGGSLRGKGSLQGRFRKSTLMMPDK